jgi:hypothetical protein
MTGDLFHKDYLERYSPDLFMEFYHSMKGEFFLYANPSRAIPFSHVPLVLDERFEQVFSRRVSLLWDVLDKRGYRDLVAQHVPEALLPPPEASFESIPFDRDHNIGCIDLHLVEGQLRMIEFMVLPPGMVGIYPGMLSRYESFLRRILPDHQPRCFPDDWNRQRCEEVMLRQITGPDARERIAVIDWEPDRQITFGEFCYTLKRIQEETGIPGVIADPREVKRDHERILVKGMPVDRILNRLTLPDWRLHHRAIEPYTRLLWESPEVFAYHPFLWYLRDKASLTILSDPSLLKTLDLTNSQQEQLCSLTPKTRLLNSFCRPGTKSVDVDALLASFGNPSQIVFKPQSSHASKGILFGPVDTPTVGRLETALKGIEPGEYVAMEYVPTPPITVPRGGGQVEPWNYDLRIFVLNGRYVFPGGRVYLGDYTNQTPCRGFAPLFLV